jgi:Flp pilus assembly protein TadB
VLVNRRSLEAADTARARLRAPEVAAQTWTLLKDNRISDVPFLNRLLTGRTWVEELRIQLERAGSELRPATFVILVAVSGIAGLLIGARMTSPFAVLLFTVLGWIAPIFWLRWRQKKRLRDFEQQLPDAIDMLVSAMRAGYSFQAATQFIGDEMIAPLGPEFARFYDEQRLGIDVRTALVGMQDRLNSIDLKMFVTAVLIQREAGGNLSEVLQNLADLVRQRISMKSQIQTLVAEPKLSARFLAVLPSWCISPCLS